MSAVPLELRAVVFTMIVFGLGALWMLLTLLLFVEAAARYIDFRLNRTDAHTTADKR